MVLTTSSQFSHGQKRKSSHKKQIKKFKKFSKKPSKKPSGKPTNYYIRSAAEAVIERVLMSKADGKHDIHFPAQLDIARAVDVLQAMLKEVSRYNYGALTGISDQRMDMLAGAVEPMVMCEDEGTREVIYDFGKFKDRKKLEGLEYNIWQILD